MTISEKAAYIRGLAEGLELDPSQKEEQKTEEGHEGKNVTVKQSVKWADGRVYHDLFESDYEAVDTVITYKNKEDLPKE